MIYIYVKVKSKVDKGKFKVGEVYACSFWGDKVCLLDIDENGHYYSHGPGILQCLDVTEVEYIEDPDV